jgi:CheY-like chemotaxis protein
MSAGEPFVPGDALHNVEVLYVDGDSQRRVAMRRLLGTLSPRRVQLAETAAEALKVIKGTACGIVVAELKMAPMDGIAMVRDLRAAANYPRAIVPVLLVSDPVGTDVIKAALAAGANHFLVKPLTPAKLYERLQWALTDSRSYVVKDGRYVVKTSTMKPSAGAAKSDLAAQR